MSYLDLETIKNYRNRFEFRNKGHIWNDASDEDFLVFLGVAGKEAKGVLRPTYAGLLMFGRDCWITHVLPNYFLDYRQETSFDIRWKEESLTIANPGAFCIPLEKAIQPGESNPRNATMLKMFAMIDAGERAGIDRAP